MVLSVGTVTLIGFSCYLEEWILKALVGYKFYWTMAGAYTRPLLSST